jgi:hypothetical protein
LIQVVAQCLVLGTVTFRQELVHPHNVRLPARCPIRLVAHTQLLRMGVANEIPAIAVRAGVNEELL